MKTAQEIVARLIEIIANIYKHPRMYAETAAELDSVLFQYHGILDYAEDRYGDSTVAHGSICSEFGQGFEMANLAPAWWHDLVTDAESPNFQIVIELWRKTDL